MDTIDATLPALSCRLTNFFITAQLPVIAGVMRDNFISATCPVITGAMDAELPINVLMGETLGPTSDITLLLGTLSTITVNIPSIGVSLEGGIQGLGSDLPSIGSAITMLGGHIAEVDVALPVIDCNVSGQAGIFAEIDAQITYMTSTLDSLAGAIGDINSVMRAVDTSINTFQGNHASLDAFLILVDSQVNAVQQITAIITVTLPSMSFVSTARLSMTQVASHITNTLTSAVTSYEQFPFNSFAKINGKYYGASSSGIFELAGDTDNTVNVDASITTGMLDFGSEMQKRMSDFFIAMRATGDITLSVMIDEGDAFEYTLSPLDIETLKQRRTLIGKGAKGKYWQFKLNNVDGCDFDIDSVNALVVPLSRRL